MTTDWLYSDYLRPLPTQRESLPEPEVELGIRLTAEEYAALLKRLEVRNSWPAICQVSKNWGVARIFHPALLVRITKEESKMTSIFPQCLVCTHFRAGYTCAAFPDDIPEDILLNKRDHRKPIEGDNGVRWAALEVGAVHPLAPVVE